MAVQSTVAPEVQHRSLPGKQQLQALASGNDMVNAAHQLPSLWHRASAAAAMPPAQPAGSGHGSTERCSTASAALHEAPAAAAVAAAPLTSAPHRALLWNKSAALPPPLHQPARAAPASPAASCRSAPAALAQSLSIDHDSAAGPEVTSPPCAGFATSPAAAAAPGASQRRPALLLGRPAGEAAAQAAAAFVKPLRLGSSDTVDLSIRPLDVTPPAYRTSAQLQSAFSLDASATLAGQAAVPALGYPGPHSRLPAKAAWLQQAVASRGGGGPDPSPCSSSAHSGYSALPAHIAAALAPPPARQPAVGAPEAAEVASQRVSKDAKAIAAERRAAAILRFRRKRAQRTFDKKVRYASRKRLAESRPRVRGQFVKAGAGAKAGAAAACHALAAQGGAVGKALPAPVAIAAM